MMFRRSFIQKSLLATGAAITTDILLSNISAASTSNLYEQKVFELPPLPYSLDALEPHIDKLTMEIHHDKHHAAYIKNLNKEVESNKELQGKTIEQICGNVSKYNIAVRNNAGGHYNHSIFWTLLSAKGGTPSEKLNKSIVRDFGSVEIMKTQFNEAAKTRFGSGWAWVIYSEGKLKICSTPNQDNPLMDIAENKGFPILAIDVWEHAYYLKYQNKRPDYIAAFWNVVNWAEVNKRFELAVKSK